MKVLPFFALLLHVLLVQIYSAQYKKKEDINIFSFLKDRIYSKIEEYQENYQHFLYLVSTLKHHFYDNYYQEPQPKYKLVKRETKQKRTLYNYIILAKLTQLTRLFLYQLCVTMLVSILIQRRPNITVQIKQSRQRNIVSF